MKFKHKETGQEFTLDPNISLTLIDENGSYWYLMPSDVEFIGDDSDRISELENEVQEIKDFLNI